MAIVGRAKYTRARENSRRCDAKRAPKIFGAPFASRLLELSHARAILPAPQSQSPKLETTRSLWWTESHFITTPFLKSSVFARKRQIFVFKNLHFGQSFEKLHFRSAFDRLCVWRKTPKAQFRRRTSHVPYQIHFRS